MATRKRSTTRKKATATAARPSGRSSGAAKPTPAGGAASKAASTHAPKGGYVRPLLYAPIGAGQLVMQKAREVPEVVAQMAADPRGRVIRMYHDLAERGERIVSGIQRSGPTRRAVDEAGSARSRVKAAATSVGKAVEATAEASRNAARRIG